jgi:pyruvate kinase
MEPPLRRAGAFGAGRRDAGVAPHEVRAPDSRFPSGRGVGRSVRMDAPRTSIVATLGPACREPALLARMIAAGADVLRVNGAHASPDEVGAWVRLAHAAGESVGRHAAVMVDLPGTKIRTGSFPRGEVALAVGARVLLAAGGDGGPDRIPVEPPGILSDVPIGAVVVLGDGGARLEVLAKKPSGLEARVVVPGAVRRGTGVHVPGVALSAPVPTPEDRVLAKAAVEAGADFVSLSFVRTQDDVGRLKDLLASLGARRLPVYAKIERLAAFEQLDAIAARSDGLLVARGDLGLDAGPERVPILQRRILAAARRQAKPAIIATEMLDSMTRATRPTRAEASDVAGAVFAAADAVMLSAESAVGAHPLLAVETMARILAEAEQDPDAPVFGAPTLLAPGSSAGRPDQAVVRAGVALAREADARAIAVYTRSGASALRLSLERPRAPIHAFTPDAAVCRRLAIAWGVRARTLAAPDSSDALVSGIASALRSGADLPASSRVVLLMGAPDDAAGTTTVVRLLTL